MMAALASLPARIGLAVLLGGAVWAGGYLSGMNAGKLEQLADTVKAYERRETINEKVQAATRYDLCVSLGGMPDQCNELRGLDKAASGK